MPLLFVAGSLIAFGALSGPERRATCVDESKEVAAMEDAVLILRTPNGKEITLNAKVADDVRKRSAGFQHICPDSVTDMAILFVFDSDVQNPFHMSNVKSPLDIAFIDASGTIREIQRMEPYRQSVVFTRRPLYRPKMPFRFALETEAGMLNSLGIVPGTVVSFRR